MCGIAGGHNISRQTISKMCERQSSRGPDNCGIKKIGSVIFGHTRLSIFDKSSKSDQPVFLGDELMLTYNGEIYNNSHSTSDTLGLFIDIKLWNEGFDNLLNSLNGMFAFAIYQNDEIILVRDRFGIKPLYYTEQNDFFAFASTPAALTLTKSDWDLSQEGLQEYLSLGGTMLHSMFDGIVAVPPGHYVIYDCNTQKVKQKRWYYPKYVDNAKEKIKEKIKQAIEKVKLSCDEKQIILLSGGIDSTLVSSRYEGQSAIHLSSPEQCYAEQVAEKYNLNLINVDPTLTSMEEGLTDYSLKSGEPTMAGFIPWVTCREISKQGYRVAITANGADELFFGYDRMRDKNEQYHAIFRDFAFTKQILPSNLNGFLLEKQPDNGWPIKVSVTNYLEWFYLMFDLNKTLDFASMCHSVEVRVPYLDHELVECALSISMDDHYSKGNKTILKEILWSLGFSKEFTDRPKIGFSIHNSPPDQNYLTAIAMAWYNSSELPKLPDNATGRQQSYHQSTVVGLYVWNKIYKLI